MVLAPPKPTPPRQQRLIPVPKGDPRLLEPGWGGDLAPDEFEYIQAELLRDKKLSFAWGFRPSAKRRPEWAVRQLTSWGDPGSRTINVALARRQIPASVDSKAVNHA